MNPQSATAVFLSVREKARRLPRKVLREIGGKTVTEHLIDRLKLARLPDLVLMTTSVHSDDRVLCDLAAKAGIPAFRGSEDDKLERYRDAAAEYGIDFAVIVDGDDLFCSEEHIDAAVLAYRATGADFITQTGLPLGAASFGVRREALEKVCRIKENRDTEVWGSYFTDSGLFRTQFIVVDDPRLARPDIRMTLDYEEDLRFFEAVFEATYVTGRVPSFRELMAFLEGHPEIVALNRSAQQKYEQNIARIAKPLKLRHGAC